MDRAYLQDYQEKSKKTIDHPFLRLVRVFPFLKITNQAIA